MYISNALMKKLVESETKTVYLALNEFVKGVLTVEHMADYPIKVIPPKFIAGK